MYLPEKIPGRVQNIEHLPAAKKICSVMRVCLRIVILDKLNTGIGFGPFGIITGIEADTIVVSKLAQLPEEMAFAAGNLENCFSAQRVSLGKMENQPVNEFLVQVGKLQRNIITLKLNLGGIIRSIPEIPATPAEMEIDGTAGGMERFFTGGPDNAILGRNVAKLQDATQVFASTHCAHA
jgi:hypothetical protein